MQTQIDELHKEGQKFYRMKKALEASRYPEAGTPTFMISTKWVD